MSVVVAGDSRIQSDINSYTSHKYDEHWLDCQNILNLKVIIIINETHLTYKDNKNSCLEHRRDIVKHKHTFCYKFIELRSHSNW